MSKKPTAPAPAEKAAVPAADALSSVADTGTFRTVGTFPLIDTTNPEALVTFEGGGVPLEAPRTAWVKAQISAGNMEEVVSE